MDNPLSLYPKNAKNYDYRYALTPTSQFYFCGIPFRLDTAPKCPLNCSYCFAMSRGGRRTSESLLANPAKLYRKIYRLYNPKSKPIIKDVVDALLLKQMPIHFGGMSDPFSSPQISLRSLVILSIFKQINYPIVISTKNTEMLQRDEILDLILSMKFVTIQVSIPIINKEFSRIIEPNVPSPMDRIAAIYKLSNLGIPVIVRVQPIIPIFITDIREHLIPAVGESGAKQGAAVD